MAWTTPRTWIPYELVTDTMLNAHVRDNLNVCARVFDQTVSNVGLPNTVTGYHAHYSSIAIPAGFLSTDGDTMVFEAFGFFAANTNQKRVVVQMAGQFVADSGSAAFNGGIWHVRCTMRRANAGTALMSGAVFSLGALQVTTQTGFAANFANATSLQLLSSTQAINDVYLVSALLDAAAAPMTIRFDSEREFGAFFCFLHFGVHLASYRQKDRTLADVVREARLDGLLATISTVDPSQKTPAGTDMRQLRVTPGAIEVDGEMLAMIDRYVRYGAEMSAPDWAATAACALDVVARAHTPA